MSLAGNEGIVLQYGVCTAAHCCRGCFSSRSPALEAPTAVIPFGGHAHTIPPRTWLLFALSLRKSRATRKTCLPHPFFFPAVVSVVPVFLSVIPREFSKRGFNSLLMRTN